MIRMFYGAQIGNDLKKRLLEAQLERAVKINAGIQLVMAA